MRIVEMSLEEFSRACHLHIVGRLSQMQSESEQERRRSLF